MYNDFIIGFSSGYINTLLYYPAFTIIHNKFYSNQKLNFTIKNIYNNNGLRGFYSGLSLFSIYLPLVRGGEIYSQKKCENLTESKTINIAIGTIYSNIWRFVIYPINTLQINKQVLNNYNPILQNTRQTQFSKISKLWNGYTYNIYSGVLSNFFWFYTYNYINDGFENNNIYKSTFSGVGASIVSDTISHPFKVFKLLKQTNSNFIFNIKTGYRGYWLKLFVNSLQGGTYGFLWHKFDNLLEKD